MLYLIDEWSETIRNLCRESDCFGEFLTIFGFFVDVNSQHCCAIVNKQEFAVSVSVKKHCNMKFAEYDPTASKLKIESAGVNENTKRAQKNAEHHFTNFVHRKLGEKYDDIFVDASILDAMLVEFFETFRLNDDRLPSRSTLRTYKSHIKGMVKRITKNAMDIGDANIFPDFDRLWKAKLLELKRNGRGDVKHNLPIPDLVMDKIYKLLALLTQLMETDNSCPLFEALLEQLPPNYRNGYHKLVLDGAIFVFILHVSFFIVPLKMDNKLIIYPIFNSFAVEPVKDVNLSPRTTSRYWNSKMGRNTSKRCSEKRAKITSWTAKTLQMEVMIDNLYFPQFG